MFKKSLVYKLTAGYILIILISTLLIGGFFINMFKDYTFQNKQKNMLQKANEVAKTMQPYIFNDKNITKYTDILSLVDSSINSRVWIAGSDGYVLQMSTSSLGFIAKDGKYNVNQLDKEILNKILKGNNFIKEEYNNFYNDKMLSVGVPIRDGENQVIGLILLHSSMSSITSTIDKAFNFLIIAILLEILFAGLLGFYFLKFFTRPLKKMNESAIEMTNGNYEIRTNIYQRDEIGELGNSLDTLAAKLQYTINQLFEERNKLNDLILSISEGILAFDLNMGIVSCNESVKSILGYSMHNTCKEKIKRDFEIKGIWDEFYSVLKDGQKKVLIKNWNNKILRLSISPVKNNMNEIAGAVVLILDISEQERLEQMRKDFIANVSHEFRTPLTLIKGTIETLIDGAVPDNQIINYYNDLLEEANSMQRMVSSLLDLSKLESGKIAFNFEKLDLSSLLGDVTRTMQFIAKEKNIEIKLNLKENISAALGDFDRLRQLLIIFIDNAIKYSYKNSTILISIAIKDYAYIKIKDYGMGIAKEDIPFIWDRFYKVDKSRNSNNFGTGLGLAIAKYLIELGNCTVEIESELNKGTAVTIGIPLFKV